MALYFFYEDAGGVLVYEGERPVAESGDFLFSAELSRAEWVRLIEACPPGTIDVCAAVVADAKSRTAN